MSGKSRQVRVMFRAGMSTSVTIAVPAELSGDALVEHVENWAPSNPVDHDWDSEGDPEVYEIVDGDTDETLWTGDAAHGAESNESARDVVGDAVFEHVKSFPQPPRGSFDGAWAGLWPGATRESVGDAVLDALTSAGFQVTHRPETEERS